MKKKITISKRKSAFASLEDFCSFSMGKRKDEGDFLEVTEWTNGEGYDITIHYVTGENKFSLTYGQYEALETCMKSLHSEEDTEDPTVNDSIHLIDTICNGYYAGREWGSKEQEEATKAAFRTGYALALRHSKNNEI